METNFEADSFRKGHKWSSRRLQGIEETVTVPDSECEKRYVYHEAINLMDDVDVDSDGESEMDDAMYMEMAFDET